MMLPWARRSCNQSSQMQTELRSLSRASPGLSIICSALLRWRDPGRRSRSSRLALTAAPSSLMQWRRRMQDFINWCTRKGSVPTWANRGLSVDCSCCGPYALYMGVAISAKKKAWTEADLQGLPDDGYNQEVVHGELVMSR